MQTGLAMVSIPRMWLKYCRKTNQKSMAHLGFTIEMVKMNAPHAEVSTKH